MVEYCYGGVMQGEGQKPPTLGTSRDNGLNRVPLDGPPTYIHEDHVSLLPGSVNWVVLTGVHTKITALVEARLGSRTGT